VWHPASYGMLRGTRLCGTRLPRPFGVYHIRMNTRGEAASLKEEGVRDLRAWFGLSGGQQADSFIASVSYVRE